MIGAAKDAEAFGADRWVDFAAHLHPLLLHLPIGLLLAALLVEVAARGNPSIRSLRRVVHLSLAVTALAAAGSGWLLGDTGDYAGELVDRHRQLGLVTAAVACVPALSDLFGRTRGLAALRVCGLVLLALLVTLTGHHGGMLTHGRTFLSSSAPPFLAALLEGEKPADDDVVALTRGLSDFQQEGVEGLAFRAIATRCIECHGPDKAKAGLRLDLPDDLLSVVVPGSPAESELVRRVRLPRTDEESMPPRGAPLSAEEIEALEAWVARGATFTGLETELERVRTQAADEEAVIASLALATGAEIRVLDSGSGASANDVSLAVDWRRSETRPTAESLAGLTPIAPRIVDLRLAGRAFDPRAVAFLPALPRLERAHLERTSVDSSAVAELLARAPRLRVLDLHTTAVDARLLPALHDADHLERVVVWDTALGALATEELQGLDRRLDWVRGDSLPRAPLEERPVRRVLAADAGRGRIALLREVALGRYDTLWERPIEALHDLAWLGPTRGEHGRVLFQDSWTRVLEVDTATDEVLWSYDALDDAATGTDDGPVEIHSFHRADDGTTWIAESGRARLVQVDAAGQILRTVGLTVDAPHPHHDTRLVRPTPSGTFLVAHERDGVVREIDLDGRVVWEYTVPLFDTERVPGHGPEAHGNQVFCALRLPDGDTLVSTGNGSSLLRVRPSGSLRWHLGPEDLWGVRLAWTTNVQVLSNGNFVLGNCHAGDDQPQAIEMTPEGERVWVFSDHERFGNDLSNLVVVEAAP